MQRIRIIKAAKGLKPGSVVVMDNNEAFGLIDSGKAVISKDMTSDDYIQAGENNGKSTQLRPDLGRRRKRIT